MERQADVAVVHGSGLTVREDGVVGPSSITQQRAKLGAELINCGVVGRLILCGDGRLASDLSDDSTTEAQVMGDVVVGECGVSPDAVLLDPASQSTVGNWCNAAYIMREQGFRSAIGVTDSIHARRARMIGEFVLPRYGLELKGYVANDMHNGIVVLPTQIKEIVHLIITRYFINNNSHIPCSDIADRFRSVVSHKDQTYSLQNSTT